MLEPYAQSACRDLYAVRFHPTVRKFMSNPSRIPYRAHKDWARKNLLEAPDTHLWLVRPEPGARAIGLTQLKLNTAGDIAEMGVMFREPQKYQWASVMSSAITLHLAFIQFACNWVTSYVIPTAQHAIDYNLRGGFSIVESDRPELVCLKMRRDVYLSNQLHLRLMGRIIPRLRISSVIAED